MIFISHYFSWALYFLCLIPSYQTRLTFYQPAKGCEAIIGMRKLNLYLWMKVTGWWLLNCLSAIQWCWFQFDKGRVPSRRSSIVCTRHFNFGCWTRMINRKCIIYASTYIFLNFIDSFNWTHTQRRTTSLGLNKTESFSMLKMGLTWKKVPDIYFWMNIDSWVY